MTMELMSMLGGGVAGFVFKFIAAQQQAQAAALDALIQKQGVADESSDRARARGGTFGRRVLLFGILWVVALAPFVGSLLGIGTYVETQQEWWDIFGIFTGGFEKLQGIILLDEFRIGLLASIGYYMGASAVHGRR